MFIPIFQVRKPRLREGKSLAQSHTARKWLSQNLNPHQPDSSNQVLNLPGRLSTKIKATGAVPPAAHLGSITVSQVVGVGAQGLLIPMSPQAG